MPKWYLFILLSVGSCFILVAEQEGIFKVSQVSEKSIYNSILKCQSPLVANTFQECQLEIDHDGKLLKGADIFVNGSMSMHSHGLPTAPKIIWSEERNTYVIKGLKFSMPGQWLLNFTINSSDNKLKDKIAMTIKVN